MTEQAQDAALQGLPPEELLKKRVKDLPLKIEGTWLEKCVRRLYRELAAKGISFRPEFYLADEWLIPDKEPVIGIPFFLADPVLMKLEKKMMYEVEGGSRKWCMKLLRHETGHAVNYAYRLYGRKKWRTIFGAFSAEYGDTYRFRPYSRNFVRHLDRHYAQYHPDEDFAETFAIWLTPGFDWRKEYEGWKALEKLQYVDELVNEIKERPPLVKKGKKHWEASKMKATLKSYYKKKRDFWAEEFPDFHDRYLQRVFVRKTGRARGLTRAGDFMKKHRKAILENVSSCTGERKFIIGNLLKVMIKRSSECRLFAAGDEDALLTQLVAYITTLTMKYIYTGRFKG